jgi:hypothetical protein
MRLVAKLVLKGDADDPDWGAVADFTYDGQNRLTKMETTYNDGEIVTTTLSPYSTTEKLTLHIEDNHSNVETDIVNLLCTFNADGTITTMASDIVSNPRIVYYTATYDANGYLTKENYDDGNGDCVMTWASGNLTKKVFNGETINYEYGSVANNPQCNLDLNWLYDYVTDDPENLIRLFRMAGRSSDKMVTKITQPWGDRALSYQTDTKGFVTKIITESYTVDVTYK